MRAEVSASVFAVAAALCAAAPALAQDAPRSAAGGAACTLDSEVELARSTSEGVAVAVAFASAGHGMVVWSTDADHLASRAIEGATTSATHTTPFAHAHDVHLLAGVRSDYLAVTAVYLCTRTGTACFQAHGLHSDGTPTGAPLEEPPEGQEAYVEAWAPAPDGLFVSQNGRWGGGLVHYTLKSDGTIAMHEIASHNYASGSSAYAAVASRGDVLWALSSQDDEGDQRTLQVLPDGAPHVVRGLPTETAVDHLVVGDDGAWLTFHVGGAASRIAKLRADGTFAERPRAVGSTPLPAALADVVTPVVEARGSTVTLRRVDAARRPVGAPAVLSAVRATRIETAVAWSGTDFVVVIARREHDGWHVVLRRARCA